MGNPQGRTVGSSLAIEARLSRYDAVSAGLGSLSDREVVGLIESGQVLGAGLGGASARVSFDGVPIFVKRIPLSDAERSLSTANVFELPPYCQYGVGSPGFGAGRELAAHQLTTGWVRERRTTVFPLLYGWRVLPGPVPMTPEHDSIEQSVEYWGGSPAVGERLRAQAKASAGLALFLEFVPQHLDAWLDAELAAGRIEPAAEFAEDRLLTAAAFLREHELQHFDAHFHNLLTDGSELYVGDLGLATSPAFDLSEAERAFLRHHASHDTGYMLMGLVNWLVRRVAGIPVPADGGPVERNEYVKRCAAGAAPVGVPPRVAAIIRRHAPVAAAMNAFYRDIFGTSRATPYPADSIVDALRRAG